MRNEYDEMPYPTGAQSRLHIENLHLCAVLNGFSPAPVETARVLEIGCGTGFNLGPMAAEFPDAFFLGMDYAASAIETGNACMSKLALQNIELRCVDLREMPIERCAEELGEFDYIISHGFYSWVPPEVRDALWDLVSHVLAPNGILHLSYNALPGWYAPGTIRDFARLLSGGANSPPSEIDRVWDALGVFARYAESGHTLAIEAARIRKSSKNVLFHDELSTESQPFYLTEVVQRAKKAGFRYVAEAGSHVPADLRKHPDVAQLILELSPDDQLLRLQLLDFTAMRRFHDTLFTRESHAPAKRHLVNTLLDCWARSDLHFVETTEQGARVYEHSGGVRLTSAHPMLCGLADALEAAAPASLSLGAFLAMLQKTLAAPSQELTLQFGHLVVKLLEAGAIQLRLNSVPVAREVGTHPQVSAFARMQVAIGGSAPNTYHVCMSIDEPWHRALLTLMDGTRDHGQLAGDLADISWAEVSMDRPGLAANGGVIGDPTEFGIAQSPVFLEHPELTLSRQTLFAYFEEKLPEVLANFLQKGYLLPVSEDV